MRRLKRGLCKNCGKPVVGSKHNGPPVFCPECRYLPARMAAHARGESDPEPVVWICKKAECDSPVATPTASLCPSCGVQAQIERGRMRKGKPTGMKGVPRSPETRAKLSAAQLGKKHSAATKERCAELVRLGITGRKLSIKNRYVCRKGRVFNLRSSWERRTAEYLDERELDWDYESVTIRLKNGDCYLPDFRLSDGSFIEVKGFMDIKDKSKIRRARRLGYVVVVFDEARLRRMGIL